MTIQSPNFRFDESDPRFLIVYEGGRVEVDDYRNVFRRWAARLEQCEQGKQETRFGVLIVHNHREHRDEGEAKRERDGDKETALVRMFNDFRRDYRERTSRYCTGYANVYAADQVAKWENERDGGLAQILERTEQFAQYNFGLPAGIFTDVETAKTWLVAQATAAPRQPIYGRGQMTSDQPSSTVGLFYGSTTGFTEMVAERLAELWQETGQAPLAPINITHMADAQQLVAYDRLLLGIPTWNIGQLQDDWEIVLPELDKLDFSGKQIAIFGVGDARGYPENFLDAVGMLGAKLRERGAQLVGCWPVEGYDFEASKALEGGRFMGLGIDEISQPEQTDARLQQWIEQVIGEFALEKVGA
ncbi:MAG: flavodoxin [Chloroflexales bacterium]|nr:flavodoxin [Chloroflexales bacterium]